LAVDNSVERLSFMLFPADSLSAYSDAARDADALADSYADSADMEADARESDSS